MNLVYYFHDVLLKKTRASSKDSRNRGKAGVTQRTRILSLVLRHRLNPTMTTQRKSLQFTLDSWQ